MVHFSPVEGKVLSLPILEIPHLESHRSVAGEFFCASCDVNRENLELRCERAYWQKQHEKACEREKQREEEICQLKARIRQLEKQVYGRRCEKSTSGSERSVAEDASDAKRRSRGHQRGAPGHGRRSYEQLPVVEELYELGEEAKRCPHCGRPVEEFPGTEDSEELEIEVKAYRRRIRRKRYRPTCRCNELPGIITAPGPFKLIPKSTIGISVWVMILLEKYLYQRPVARLLESLKGYGLDIPSGTVGDGLKRLHPLFLPVYQAIATRSRRESWWHADETRWMVFQLPEGKLSYRWYLWVFVSHSVVLYVLDPRRSAEVLQEHLGEVKEGILCVDRYAAYKRFARTHRGICLAFCWTHQRRDFLEVGNRWPELEGWAQEWVQDIGTVFHLNRQRVSHPTSSAAFAQADEQLRKALRRMARGRERQLRQAGMDAECLAVLESMRKHWKGFQVFVDHPHIPPDNSEAERRLRAAAVGRKNYYGSGSLWSASLTACLFSLFQTLLKWNINPRTWLQEYLTACAQAGGVPKGLGAFLPWRMSEGRRTQMGLPRIRGEPSPCTPRGIA